mgnify:CR=1 FL=1
MNKVLSRLALCLFCFLIPIHDAAAAPALTAEAAILMDYQSGEILYCKNAYESRPPASLTKVMTTILAIASAGSVLYSYGLACRCSYWRIAPQSASGRADHFGKSALWRFAQIRQ